MKHLFLFLAFTFCAVTVSAQYKVCVQNKTKTEFYNSFETALSKAVSGDTLYLPGAELKFSGNDDIVINKQLFIIGAGADSDSTGGVNRTEFRKANGNLVNLNFNEGSSGSLMAGCVLGDVSFGESKEKMNIEKVTLLRNNMQTLNLGIVENSKPAEDVRNIIIMENVVKAIYARNAYNCLVTNNLVNWYGIFDFNSSQINNNVIITTLNNHSISHTGCIFRNNFFISYTNVGGSNNTFENNAFTNGDFNLPQGTNKGSNNIYNIDISKTFLSVLTNGSGLDYPKNLRLKEDSPCRNAGKDGNDIGLYGGTNPYKSSMFTPRFDNVDIATQTDVSGKLKVKIQVSAQTR